MLWFLLITNGFAAEPNLKPSMRRPSKDVTTRGFTGGIGFRIQSTFISQTVIFQENEDSGFAFAPGLSGELVLGYFLSKDLLLYCNITGNAGGNLLTLLSRETSSGTINTTALFSAVGVSKISVRSEFPNSYLSLEVGSYSWSSYLVENEETIGSFDPIWGGLGFRASLGMEAKPHIFVESSLFYSSFDYENSGIEVKNTDTRLSLGFKFLWY